MRYVIGTRYDESIKCPYSKPLSLNPPRSAFIKDDQGV